MKRLAAFLILSALTACSSTPDPIPDCKIPAPAAAVGHPLSVPEWPVEARSDAESATYDREGLLQLKRVQDTLDTNTKVAKENATALEARNVEVTELIECARYQNVWIQVHTEDLKDEKRAHFIDVWFRNGIIALGLIGAAL